MKYLFVVDSPLSKGYQSWLFGEAAKIGISSAECSVLPLINEKPAGKGGVPLAAQLEFYRPTFFEALRITQAEVVIPMGAIAARSVLGSTHGLDTLRGYCFRPDDCGTVTWREHGVVGEYKTSNKTKGYKKGDPRYGYVTHSGRAALPDCWIIPTYAVSYVIRNRKKPVFALIQDLKRAKRAADGLLVLLDAAFDSGRQFYSAPVVDWAPLNDQFAFDIETAQIAKGEYSREPRSYAGVSLSDGVITMALDWNEETRAYVNKYLGNPKYKKFAHNAMFDVPRLRDAGSPVTGPIVDTMLAGQLLQPDLLKRLESMASVYLDLRCWKALNETDPYFYSAKDSFVTLHLANVLLERIKSLGMDDLLGRMMRALPVLLDMNEKGIKVDVQRAREWCSDLENKLIELEMKWNIAVASLSNRPVSPSSPQQIHKFLYGHLGMEVQKNKFDGDTTGAEAIFNLKLLYPQHAPLLTVLEDYRDIKKQHGTYAKTLAGLFTKGEDRVHPQYLPGGSEGATDGAKGGASTGRLGVSNPNIQNQPPAARRMYIPDGPDQCFIEFDYSQAELRVIAALSGDTGLSSRLSGDIHQITADRLGIPRPLAKNTIYASCYLGGPKTIQSMLKRSGILLDIATIRDAQNKIRGEYPRMFAWQQVMVSRGTTAGYLVNPFGRVRFFYGKADDGPEAADFNPQSTVADMTWSILPALQECAHRYGGRVVTQVHDSYLFSIPKDKVKAAVLSLRNIMEQPFEEVANGFTIPTDVKIGEPGASWGDLKKDHVQQ